jgi:hypothetical protein
MRPKTDFRQPFSRRGTTADTDREIRASFDRESSAARVARASGPEPGDAGHRQSGVPRSARSAWAPKAPKWRLKQTRGARGESLPSIRPKQGRAAGRRPRGVQIQSPRLGGTRNPSTIRPAGFFLVFFTTGIAAQIRGLWGNVFFRVRRNSLLQLTFSRFN